MWGQIPISSNISINWDLTPGFGRGPVLDTGFQLTCLRLYGSGQQYRDNPQNGHACPAAQVKVMDQFIGLVK